MSRMTAALVFALLALSLPVERALAQTRDNGELRRLLRDRTLDPIRERARDVDDESSGASFVESPVAIDEQGCVGTDRVAHRVYPVEAVMNAIADWRRVRIFGYNAIEGSELDDPVAGSKRAACRGSEVLGRARPHPPVDVGVRSNGSSPRRSDELIDRLSGKLSRDVRDRLFDRAPDCMRDEPAG